MNNNEKKGSMGAALKLLRRQAEKSIAEVMEKYGLESLDIDEVTPAEAPVVYPDPCDGNGNWRLKGIEYADKEVWLIIACGDREQRTHPAELDADRLAGIADYLERHEDKIAEAAGVDNSPMKYVFRFHRDAWVDITVYASNAEDALDEAHEKYNAGDYEDSDEDFENTNVEDVTVNHC